MAKKAPTKKAESLVSRLAERRFEDGAFILPNRLYKFQVSWGLAWNPPEDDIWVVVVWREKIGGPILYTNHISSRAYLVWNGDHDPIFGRTLLTVSYGNFDGPVWGAHVHVTGVYDAKEGVQP